MKNELSKVLRNIISVMSGSIDESTVGGLSASVSNSALSQMQKAYNLANQRQRTDGSIRSRKSSPHTDRAVPDISDEMRVTIARDLCTQLNSDIAHPNFPAYSSAAILNQLKGQNLIILANQLAADYDGDVGALDQAT